LILLPAGADLGGGWIGRLATSLLVKQKLKKIKKTENDCDYFGRNKGKNSGQIPHPNF